MNIFQASMDFFQESHLLLLALVIPMLAAIGLLALPARHGLTRLLASIGFGAPLLIAFYLAFNFEPHSSTGYDYLCTWKLQGFESFGVAFELGLNGIALPLYVMAALIGAAAGFQAFFSGAQNLRVYLALLLITHAGLLGIFCSVNLFFIYSFHEFALVPAFLMMHFWGRQGRTGASMEMVLYLGLGALLSLFGILLLQASGGDSPRVGLNLIALKEHFQAHGLGTETQNHSFGLLFFGLGILVSMFPFHGWALRTYAILPSAAAMLHAGVLKQFGFYVLIQLALPLLPLGAADWAPWMACLALGNILVIGFIAMGQYDLRSLIACSSVMHVGYIFLGIATFSKIGLQAALILMVAHGLSAAALHAIAASIVRRTGTYLMDEMGGLSKKAPHLTALFIAAAMAGIGLPGFISFWGELGVSMALFRHLPALLPFALAGILIASVYSLRAIARIFYGEQSPELQARGELANCELGLPERIPTLVLLLALLLLGIFPQWLLKPITAALNLSFHP